MGNFLDGIEYPIFAGIGALIGLWIFTPILALLGFIFPALWGAWLLSPAAVGAVLGLIIAGRMK